jgi:hypothetical protein
VRPFVDEKNRLLSRAWPSSETHEVATVTPHQRDRQSPRPIVAGNGNACAGNTLEQIPCLLEVDAPRDAPHACYPRFD